MVYEPLPAPWRGAGMPRQTADKDFPDKPLNYRPQNDLQKGPSDVEPERRGLTPTYAQKLFPEAARRGTLLPVVSSGSVEGTLPIHQDATLYVGSLEPGQSITHQPTVGEHQHLYVVTGSVRLGEQT